MYIYSLEFFIDNLNLDTAKPSEPNMVITVTISDLLNFRVPYMLKMSRLMENGNGKALFFSAPSISGLVSAFSSEIKIVVFKVTQGNEDYFASANIKWDGNFETAASTLKEENTHIECEVKHPLFKDKQEIGTITVQMCLVYFGMNIEIPITYMGSQLAVPMTFRRKSSIRKIGKKEDSGTWAPLFFSPKRQTRSMIDPTMEIYAEMAGISARPRIQSLLTPDYINKNLCTHKCCPGAKKFKEFGLGPLAPQGSGLGSVSGIKEVKPYGMYGMSQAYGTLDSYGAYGLFVKKSDKKRKSCCGSPDCPYTTFYGVQEVMPEGEDMPPTPTINELINKPKKCQCKNCKKYNASKSSKSSSQKSTCSSPNCPKKTPKIGVPCPFRQSAGADDWNPKPCCKTQACPFGAGSNDIQSLTRQGVQCGGAICPAKPEDCLGPSCNMTSCDDENNRGRRRSSSSAQPTGLLDNLNSFLDKTTALAGKQNNYGTGESDGSDENCEDETCPAYKGKKPKKEFEQKYGLCAGKVCPLEQKTDDVSAEGYSAEGYSTKQKKRLSLLLNENGQKMLLGKDDLTNTEMFASLPRSEQSHMVLMISRLLEQRQRSHSLNNYYNPELSLSMQNFVSTMRLRSFDTGKGVKPNPFEDKFPKEMNKRKGPCSQDSCKSFKYKRCSECGGISKSGATCDNTDVSFSTISYDSVTTPGAGDPKLIEDTRSDVKKGKITNKGEMTVKIAKSKKRNSKFAYAGGENYPGVRFGHKACVYASKNVPAHMGWLWNIKNEGEKRKRKNKWKPGYLRKDIEAAIVNNRRNKGIPDPPELKMLLRNKRKNVYESDDEEEQVLPKPTLIIEKKNGNYLITMHPLKDPKKLEEREDPYMRCKPIQFEITKPPKKVPDVPFFHGYDEMEGEYEDSNYDYFKNTCYCDGDDVESSASSSDSELNIEFTTPAGIIIPDMFKKPPNVCNVDTQFKITDFACNDCPIIVPQKFKRARSRSPGKKKVA